MQEQKSENKNAVTRMELKYCECCGSLWLRESGAAQIYCRECLPDMKELPQATTRIRKLKLPNVPRPLDDSDFELELESDFELDLEEDDFDLEIEIEAFDINELKIDIDDGDAITYDAGGVA
jgi:hypothetical protein